MWVCAKVYDFLGFLLSRDISGKSLTFPCIAKCTMEIAKCHTISSEKFTTD